MRVGGIETPEFDALYRPMFLRAYRLAYRIVNDQGEAEDAASIALAKAALHWERVGSLPYREAWVLRVAGNEARTIVRKRRRRQPPVPEPLPGWEDRLLTRVALAQAVAQLPTRQRQAVTLRYLAGLDDDEIAACLRIANTSVRTHARRGLIALRARLPRTDADIDLTID